MGMLGRDTKAEVVAIPVVLPENALEAKTLVVASPMAALDLVIDCTIVPHTGSSRKNSHHVLLSSSSSVTSHPSSSPLLRSRHQLSSYSTPPAYVGPSHKRCRSPTTSLPTSALALAVLSSVHAHRLPPHKSLNGSPAISYQDVTIEGTAKPASPPENTSLHDVVRATELSDNSTRVALETMRVGLAEMRRQVRDTAEQLQQCQIAQMHDRQRISRIEAYLRRYF
nr:hypothetical protein [Tanacetum cinerariifolium]